jgi:hypothetical protein
MKKKKIDGNSWISLIIFIAILAAILYLIYWLVMLHMKTFEILFGNGWLYFAFLLAGFVLSFINIPLYQTGERDIVFVNVGGCLLPLGLSAYLLYKIWYAINPTMLLLAILIVILVSRAVSWYVEGEGVLIFLAIVEISIVLLAHFLPFYSNTNSNLTWLKMAFGYAIGSVGVLIGGDLLHISMIGRDGRWHDKLSIGGAGTKDGIWAVGITSMLLILLCHNFFGW